MHLEILLEERCMENVLNVILPQVIRDSQDDTWHTHPHYGKAHLLKQLPQKLRAYSRWLPQCYPESCIVIIVDQDQDDCRALKRQIREWAEDAGVASYTLIRIPVPMLEAWLFGDVEALEMAFPRLRRLRLGTKADYRNPEHRSDPARDLDREMKQVGYESYSKVKHSAEIAPYLSLDEGHNRSHSFQVTLMGLKALFPLIYE